MIIHLKDKKNVVARPEDVYTVLQALLAAEDAVDRDKEHVWVFQLDTRLRIKVLELVSLGTLNACLVQPREVFTRAVANRCHGILVAHNHPSGETTPSHEDVMITKQLVEAGKILDIPLIDHIVIGDGTYLSLKEQGLF